MTHLDRSGREAIVAARWCAISGILAVIALLVSYPRVAVAMMILTVILAVMAVVQMQKSNRDRSLLGGNK